MSTLDEFDRLDDERWARIDAIALDRGMDPPSGRRQLVERVAWGMHAARGLGSPRAAWAEMPEDERVELLLQAAGAMVAFEHHTPYLREEVVRPLWEVAVDMDEKIAEEWGGGGDDRFDAFPAPDAWKRPEDLRPMYEGAADEFLTLEETTGTEEPSADRAFMADRCRDAWAILRGVSPVDADRQLQRHDRPYDEERGTGTPDGLADDMLTVVRYLSAERA